MKNSLNMAWDNFKLHFKEWQKKRRTQEEITGQIKMDNSQSARGKIINQIEIDNSQTFDECVGSFLKIYGNLTTYSSAFQNFIVILKEKGLYNENKIDDLRYKLGRKKFEENINNSNLKISNPEESRKLTKSEYIQQEEQKRLKRKETEELFLTSSEYVFIRKAAEKLLNGSDINYSIIKAEIENQWDFSTNQLSKLISNEVENIKIRIEEENKFYNSQSYKCIKQFAKKYGEKGKAEDFNQLQILLENWQYDFSIEELKSLVAEESKKQRIENLKSRFLSENPHNRGAILKNYLNFYRSGDEINLKILASLLEERYSASEDILELKTELQTIEKRIEIENFEKRLLEEDEQIQLGEIDNFNGYEFEDFLKTLFSKMGYQVKQTKLSGDQGADLVVVKFGEKSVIQAKRFGGKVGNKAVQEI